MAENFDDAGLEQRRTSFENLLCIEIFSGSGKLTASLHKIGLWQLTGAQLEHRARLLILI